MRLWIDDPSALAWMAPDGCAGVSVVAWTAEAARTGADPAPDVLVEAFGCDPAPEIVASFVKNRSRSFALLGIDSGDSVPTRL